MSGTMRLHTVTLILPYRAFYLMPQFAEFIRLKYPIFSLVVTVIFYSITATTMRQSKHVRYIKANTLMSEMEQSRLKSANLDYLNKLTHLDLLVMTHLSYRYLRSLREMEQF